jgi:hypothetical protein
MSDINKLLRELARQGFTYRGTGSGHYLVWGPDGKVVTTLPASPSDWRSLKNAIAVLRRAGFTWKGK